MAQRILCILPPHYLSVISFLLTLLMPSFSLPSSLYLGTNRCHSRLPLWSAHASCRLNLCMPTSAWVAWFVTITHVLRLTELNPSGSFSSISYRHCAVSACELLLFHFYFNLGVILIYSPRSYEAGAFLSYGPAWTAYGLGQ